MKPFLKLIFVAIFSFVITNSFAQNPFRPLPKHSRLTVSPFHHLTHPNLMSLSEKSIFSKNEVTAYRFVLPFAGYSIQTRQISTGLGFGWNKLHWIDSTQTYYTDLSIYGAILVNGNVTPTPYNYTSIGLGVGFLNGLLNIIPSFNLPSSDKPKGAFDLKVSFGLTLK